MGDRTHLIDEVLAESGVRLGAYGWLLTGSESAAADLVQSGVVEAMSRARRPRDLETAEEAVRAQMRRLAARDAKRARPNRDQEDGGEATATPHRRSSAGGVPQAEDASAGADAVDLSAWEYRPQGERALAAERAAAASEVAVDEGSRPSLTYDASLWEPPISGQDPDALGGSRSEEFLAAHQRDLGDSGDVDGHGDDDRRGHEPNGALSASEGAEAEVYEEEWRDPDSPGSVALAHALSGLEPRVRVAVVMAEVDHLDTEQIARTMRVPAHAVDADLAFGRSELARVLGLEQAHHVEHVNLVPGGAR